MKLNWKWISYTSILAFSTYWLVNLLLWYPWSYSALLGMTLMFVAITPVWFYSIFLCLKTFAGDSLCTGATYTSLIISFIAIALDYVFYGIIRDAMTELYHPTTFYGYAFLLSLPFIEVIVLKKRLKNKASIKNNELIKFGIVGFLSFLAIVLIIKFDLKLSESNFKFLTFIFSSLVVFFVIVWAVLGTNEFKHKLKQIVLLSMVCVVFGMLIGKYGVNFGLKWWIYYSIPMLMNVLLPPVILKMKMKQVSVYLLLSFMSAPFIHIVFSFFFNWTEYLPFFEIPYWKTLL